LTPWHLTHYVTRAIGGVGLIITEATAISKEGRISNKDIALWNDEQLDMYKTLSKLLHENGAKIGVQLAHAGRKSETDDEIIAPSALKFNENFKAPKEMNLDDIEKVKQDFINAAKRAIEADIDIIEIHAAHGYLINQFLSPLTNKRKDEYGGSFTNRNRLLKEIVCAIREIWDGPLFVRISADENAKEGNHIEESIKTSLMLKECGVDLIDVSSGGVIPVVPKVYPGYQSFYAKEIKENVQIMTGTVGMIKNEDFAEFLLNEGFADLIFLGRVLLRNPYWPIETAFKMGKKIYPKAYERAYE